MDNLASGGIFCSNTIHLFRRPGITLQGITISWPVSLGVLGQTEFGKGAVKLISDSRTEIAKVVWPSRGETTQMTIMVLVMILILALIFWGLDSLLSFLSRFILS